jgi:membrane fusion protein (multidrug efflux system)
LATPALQLPAELPSELLGRRPDIVAARWRVEAAGKQIVTAKTRFYPSINLRLIGGVLNKDVGQLFEQASLFGVVAPAVSLPLFDGGKLRANLAARNADYDLAVADYNQKVLRALGEVVDQLNQARSLQARVQQQQQALLTQSSAFELAQRRYRAGIGSYLEVLSVQQQLLVARQAMSELQVQQILCAVRLRQALGGGVVAAPRTRGKLLWSLAVVVIVLLAVIAIWYFIYGRWYEETDDAYVQGNQVQITPLLGGTVVSIAAEDGMRVERGQLLVQLDPADTAVALQQAEASLARTVRQVRGLYRSVVGAQAELAAREVVLKRARADFARRKDLASSGAISSEELAHAQAELASAQAAVSGSREQYERSHALVDATEVASHPDVQAAAAQLRQAWLNHARSAIVAPVSGYVARRSVQVGQRVQPGAALMMVVPMEQLWVEANFKETQLKHMRLGQEVELTSDLYGAAVSYRGRIDSLGLGTGSAFSLLPAQNASGNWIKIVQRVPVRISIEPGQLAANPLRIGLSMQAQVNLHDQDGSVLPTKPASGALLATDVYAQQLQQADAAVQQIIQANLPQTAQVG